MASQINTTNINEQFPVPGEDNDTQVFRDNFKTIKTNLDSAKSEIENLQDNTARTDKNTDFNGTQILDADLANTTLAVYDLGNIAENTTVFITNGNVQRATVTADLNFSITNWPSAPRHSVLRLELLIQSQPITIDFAPQSGQEFRFDGRWPSNLIIDSDTNPTILEFSSADGGKTISAEYKGKRSLDKIEPFDIRDLTVYNNALIEGNLTVTGTTQIPDINIPVNLNSLEDVNLDSVDDKQILRYNISTGLWENRDFEDIVDVEVVVADDGTGSQDVFYLDQSAITDINNYTLDVGKTYRFDLSDPTNSSAPMRFSTTPDTNVPDSINEYLDGVTINGTAGQAGASIEIQVTDSTPNPLYFYAIESGLDTSLIGGGTDAPISIGIKRKAGVFDTLKGNLEGTLTVNNTEVIDADAVVSSVVEPTDFRLPNVTTAERDNLNQDPGRIVYNTDNNKVEVYISGTGWIALAQETP